MLALATALPAGEFEQTVVVLDGRGPLKSVAAQAGLEVVCVDQRWSLDPTALARLSGELRKRTPSVIHTWDDASRQYVTAIAGGSAWRMVSEWSPKERRGFQLFGPTSRRGRPDRWVVASDADRLTASHRVELDTISVIPPGVSLDVESRLSREELWSKLNLPAASKNSSGPLTWFACFIQSFDT
jgi:hypothetical protein